MGPVVVPVADVAVVEAPAGVLAPEIEGAGMLPLVRVAPAGLRPTQLVLSEGRTVIGPGDVRVEM